MARTTTARGRLERWVDALPDPRYAVAARLGCDPSQLSRLIAGERTPDLALAVAIERATGGAIKAEDWLDDGGARESSR